MNREQRRQRQRRRRVLTYDLKSGESLEFAHEGGRSREPVTVMLPRGVTVRRRKRLDSQRGTG